MSAGGASEMQASLYIANVIALVVVIATAMGTLGFGGGAVLYGLAAILAPSFGKAHLFSFRGGMIFAGKAAAVIALFGELMVMAFAALFFTLV